MRVVYVSTLGWGGPVSHLLYLAPHVAAAGIDVEVVCGSERIAAAFRARGLPADVVEVRSRHDVRGGAALLRRLKTADVVHTHDRRAGLYGRTFGRMAGARVVHTWHGLPEPIAGRLGRSSPTYHPAASRVRVAWLLHGYLRLEATIARLGTVVVPSETMAGFLRAHGMPARRLRVIPSGVDVRRTEARPVHAPLVVATAAYLHHLKGIDVLVAACAQVERPLQLEVFGWGECREPLERQAAELGVTAHFHGRVDGFADRLADVDLFVLPSRGENLPISILEAMAEAVPVVATRVGGVPELVGDAGVLVEPDDPVALAAAIRGLIDEPARRDGLASKGALRAKEHFDAATQAQRLVDLYREE